ARQSLRRSSGLVAQEKSVPPCSNAIFWTVSACSFTLLSMPWNSSHNVGATRRLSFEYLLIASICTASASSIRATGTPNWIVLITTLTAALTLGKEQTAEETAAGTP